MKRFLAIALCFLMLFLAACTSNNNQSNENTKAEETYEIIQKELLTPETVIAELCGLGDFACMLQTPGCNEVYNSQINLSEPVVKSYRFYDNNTGEYVHLLCLASVDDAKMASYAYDGYDYTNRLGAMYLFGTAECIEDLSFSGYKYPDSFEAEGADSDPESVAGIVKAIEDKTELCGGYYSVESIEETKNKINQKFTLEGGILNLVHLTYHDGTVLRFVYIYEFESENDAVLYEEDRAAFSQGVEDGVCIRIGTKVVFGNHSIVSEIG
ncbi:MAG: hypothetical protein IKT46_09360 [Clostridia bacterium]|nr:hypothetical protein [Clostridia bacterium]